MLKLVICLPTTLTHTRDLYPRVATRDIKTYSPSVRRCKESFVPRELVLLLCLPSVDALRDLRPKGVCPVSIMLCLPSVDALRELRPKGVCPDVVFQVSML